MPNPIRTARLAALPAAASSPATPSAIPASTADATRYAPSAHGPALPSAAPTAVITSARLGRGGGSRSCAGANPAALRPTPTATSRMPAANSAKVGRQPRGRASRGSARPLASTAAGIAVCFTPNASPWRSRGTWSAMNKLMAGWQTELDRPASASAASNSASEGASEASPSRIALATRQPRIARSAPARSAKRPPAPAPSAPAAKKTVTPAATAPTLTPRSSRICSASTPTRNPGTTVPEPAAIATADVRASRGEPALSPTSTRPGPP